MGSAFPPAAEGSQLKEVPQKALSGLSEALLGKALVTTSRRSSTRAGSASVSPASLCISEWLPVPRLWLWSAPLLGAQSGLTSGTHLRIALQPMGHPQPVPHGTWAQALSPQVPCLGWGSVNIFEERKLQVKSKVNRDSCSHPVPLHTFTQCSRRSWVRGPLDCPSRHSPWSGEPCPAGWLSTELGQVSWGGWPRALTSLSYQTSQTQHPPPPELFLHAIILLFKPLSVGYSLMCSQSILIKSLGIWHYYTLKVHEQVEKKEHGFDS